MRAIATTIVIIPTATPALKIPAITVQPLKHSISKTTNGKPKFFMMVFMGYNIQKVKIVLTQAI